jgi:hypothetical protein
MKTRREHNSRPWAFFTLNIMLIVLLIAMHPYYIITNEEILYGKWLYYFLAIEVPAMVYLVFNMMFLGTFFMVKSQ